MSLIKTLKNQSKLKLIFGILVLAGIFAAVFLNPKDQQYFENVEREIRIAMKVCENSRERILSSIDRLKIDNNKIEDVPVNGKIPQFKYVKVPRVLFFKQGFEHTHKRDELFCTFRDPRDQSKFFYNYRKSVWEKNSRTRK